MTPKRVQRSLSIGYLLKLDDNNNGNNNNNNNNSNIANDNDNANKGKIKKRRKTLMVESENRSEALERNRLLVEMVQAWPCLYDTHYPTYGRKEALDEAWEKIAEGIGSTVNFCKERWRNIRSAYGRSIGYYRTDPGPNHIKPYYLHKELEFLTPIICKDIENGRGKNSRRGKRRRPKASSEYQNESHLEAASENSTIIELFSDSNDEDSRASDRENALVSTSTLEIEVPLNEESDKREDVSSTGSVIIAAGRKRKASTASERENPKRSLDLMSATNMGETVMLSPISCDNYTSNRRDDNQNNNIGENNIHRIQMNNNNNKNSMLQDQAFLNCILDVMQNMNQRQNHIFKEKIWESVRKVFDMPDDYPNRTSSEANVSENSDIISSSKTVMQEMTCSIANLNETELRQLQVQIQQRERQLDKSEQRSVEITGGNENHLNCINSNLSARFPQPMLATPVTIKEEPLSDEEFLV